MEERGPHPGDPVLKEGDVVGFLPCRVTTTALANGRRVFIEDAGVAVTREADGALTLFVVTPLRRIEPGVLPRFSAD
jgi:hypothetical protein